MEFVIGRTKGRLELLLTNPHISNLFPHALTPNPDASLLTRSRTPFTLSILSFAYTQVSQALRCGGGKQAELTLYFSTRIADLAAVSAVSHSFTYGVI